MFVEIPSACPWRHWSSVLATTVILAWSCTPGGGDVWSAPADAPLDLGADHASDAGDATDFDAVSPDGPGVDADVDAADPDSVSPDVVATADAPSAGCDFSGGFDGANESILDTTSVHYGLTTETEPADGLQVQFLEIGGDLDWVAVPSTHVLGSLSLLGSTPHVSIVAGCSDTGCDGVFWAVSGTLNVKQFPTQGAVFEAELVDVELVESEIFGASVTPIPGGRRWCLPGTTPLGPVAKN